MGQMNAVSDHIAELFDQVAKETAFEGATCIETLKIAMKTAAESHPPSPLFLSATSHGIHAMNGPTRPTSHPKHCI